MSGSKIAKNSHNSRNSYYQLLAELFAANGGKIKRKAQQISELHMEASNATKANGFYLLIVEHSAVYAAHFATLNKFTCHLSTKHM